MVSRLSTTLFKVKVDEIAKYEAENSKYVTNTLRKGLAT